MTTLGSAPGVRPGLASWPLTPIEELDLYLENAAEPSVIQLETPVRGHLDHAVLEAALADVLAAEPAGAAAPGRHLPVVPSPALGNRRTRYPAGTACSPWPAGAAADQLAALRERLSAWPIPLHDRAVRLHPGGGT